MINKMTLLKDMGEFFINSKVLGVAVAVTFSSLFGDLIKVLVKEIVMKSYIPKTIIWPSVIETSITFILSVLLMFFVVVVPFNSTILKNDASQYDNGNGTYFKIRK